MPTNTQVTHVVTHTAEEFLHAISPRSRYLESALDRFSHYFIYRGHADDRWKLIPKALRLGEPLERPLYGWGTVNSVANEAEVTPHEEFFTQLDGGSRDSWSSKDQVLSEWNILKMFFKVADLNGLPLPEDSQHLRTVIEKSLVRELNRSSPDGRFDIDIAIKV